MGDVAQYVLEMGADLSHHPPDLPRLLAPIREDRADLALGSRYVAGGAEGWLLRRQLLGCGGSLYARSLLRAPVHDLTGGFKRFHRRVVEVPIIFSERQHGKSKMTCHEITQALASVYHLRLVAKSFGQPAAERRPVMGSGSRARTGRSHYRS